MHLTKSIDCEVDAAILTITAHLLPDGYDVADEAPQSYDALRAYLDAGGRMCVWGGGSERTIYGSAAVNFAFRAWHDLCHYVGHHDFTLNGEIGACALQCRQLARRFGATVQVRRWQAIIRAEIIGQALYYQRHQRFPADQRAFVLAYLTNPETNMAAAL